MSKNNPDTRFVAERIAKLRITAVGVELAPGGSDVDRTVPPSGDVRIIKRIEVDGKSVGVIGQPAGGTMSKNNPDTRFVAERITKLRIEHGISEYQLSLDLGFSKGEGGV